MWTSSGRRRVRGVACWLDAAEFRATGWQTRPSYRTRMAIADRGELIVLASGVRCFGEETPSIGSSRRHGFFCADADAALLGRSKAATPSSPPASAPPTTSSTAAPKLVPGHVLADPDQVGLIRSEVVGYGWRPLADELATLGVDERAGSGTRRDTGGEAFDFIANPALGLWATGADGGSRSRRPDLPWWRGGSEHGGKP